MQTKILTVSRESGGFDALQEPAQCIAEGGLVVFPTETVYGLGADGLNEQAVRSIFAAKERPADNPLILHICEQEQLADLTSDIPESAKKAARHFWPGPFTMVLPKSAQVPDVVTGGLSSVAVRFPDHPIARELIRRGGKIIAAPSANRSGRPSPTTAAHCIDDLMGRVHWIIDGGPCEVGLESTVVSFTGRVPKILRPGAVTADELGALLGEVELDSAVVGPMGEHAVASSPGMKYKHYAPLAKVILVKADRNEYIHFVNSQTKPGSFALCFDEERKEIKIPSLGYGKESDGAAQARELFGCLRELDKQNAQTVFAHCPNLQGVGLAVYNRLLRAAAFDVITL